MKKLLLVSLLIVLIFVLGIFWFYFNIRPVASGNKFGNFLIAKGSSASQIGAKLEKDGFIKSQLAFRIYVKVTGQASKIPTGEFRLSPSYSLFQTVSTLLKGPIEIWVTVPEGLRREEIAAKFAAGLEKDDTFNADFLKATAGSEGYLFPDTYLFPKEASASAIASKMKATFSSKTASLNLTKDQVILASLLERETKTAEERPIVAGILLNRLKLGMPLQVDAAVQYAVGASKNWWPILSRDDLTINSHYNTYKFQGLPPGPIASAGMSSLNAAANPVKTDYLYYIHDTEGTIHYAKTLAEHNANVHQFLGK